jgi:hypothetical protein
VTRDDLPSSIRVVAETFCKRPWVRIAARQQGFSAIGGESGAGDEMKEDLGAVIWTQW